MVLDVDTGIDDALALMYAVASPLLDLRAVTTVSGNVPAEIAARNSCDVLAHVGAQHVPVSVGAAQTKQGRGSRTGPTNHGPDGLGGVVVPPALVSALATADPDTVVAQIAHEEDVTLVGLAPMTNVARLAQHADRLVLVCGEMVAETPPEFNAAHDPAATAEVLSAGRSMTLYVADVFEQVVVPDRDVALLRASARPGAKLAGELLHVRRAHLVGDAGALVLLTHPHLFVTERRHFGLVGDALTEVPGGRAVEVVTDVDATAVATVFVETVLVGA